MRQGYEDTTASEGPAGCVIAALAFVVAIVMGGTLLGFAAVLDPLLQLAAATTAMPGAVTLFRSFVGAIGVASGRSRSGVSVAWRRLGYGSMFISGAALAWAIFAITTRAER